MDTFMQMIIYRKSGKKAWVFGVQEKTFINDEQSFAKDKIAKMNVSRKRALKQSEEYYFKFAVDPNNPNRTHCFLIFYFVLYLFAF